MTDRRPYQQIADIIREQIRTGDLQPGAKVPSVREIVRQHGVAMATAQRAVRVLQAEGFVRSERGSGSVVTSESERGWSASAWIDHSRRSGRVYPTGQKAHIVAAAETTAPEQVAGALGLEPGASVVRRDRITYEADRPVSASTSWFSARLLDVAPRLAELARIPEGTFVYVAVRTGRRVASWRDQYDPGVATEAEAASLDVEPGTPLHRGRNWVYDEVGEVIEYGESVSTGRVTYTGQIDT